MSHPATCSVCGHQQPATSAYCNRCGSPMPGLGTGRLPQSFVLQNRYAIVATVGQGGFGAVYRVADQRLPGVFWALKEMSDAAIADPQQKVWAISAFRQEAQLLARLNHPNIPRVSDYFTENNKHYIVMEFVAGETLEARLSRQPGPIDEGTVRQWTLQLCDVLAYLHGQQPPIIFRDLKPGNIMLTPQGQLKLIDFGIARLFKPGQATDTQPVGTKGYAPPEQYGKGQTDAQSDIYSLGVVLHELVTRHDPSSTPINLPPVRSLNPAISPELAQIITTATLPNKQQRFQNVTEITALLTGSTSGPNPPPSLPPTVPVASVPARRVGRRGVPIGLVLLGMVIILGAGAAIASGLLSPPASTPTSIVYASTDTPTLIEMTPEPASPTAPTATFPSDDTATPEPPTATPTAAPASTVTPSPTPTSTPQPAVIQVEIEEVLLRWSEIHKKAVYFVIEDELATILAGEALEQQLKSIRWLREHNAYWVVATRSRGTVAWEDLTPERVQVVVWRDERGDYYEKGKHFPKTSYDEYYEARFIIEKLNGNWFITCKGTFDENKPEPCLDQAN